MSRRPVRLPSADHPITIAPNPNRVMVTIAGRVIADSVNARTLREARYPAVHYLPRTDVDMTQLAASDHASYCPYKGEAGYFDLPALGEGSANAVWTYEEPFDAVAAIAGHLAFYTDRVTLIEQPAG